MAGSTLALNQSSGPFGNIAGLHETELKPCKGGPSRVVVGRQHLNRFASSKCILRGSERWFWESHIMLRHTKAQLGPGNCRLAAHSSAALEEDIMRSTHEYNQAMRRQMKNPYEYHHDLGMHYTRVHNRLIVGSQPQSPEDVKRLVCDEGVSTILNLQQDHDMRYWGIDLEPIRGQCEKLGVRHYRRPAKDFDPHSLRYELPRMVAVIDRNVVEGRTVYVHCTAGLGRAPGAAIAYLFWFQDMDMDTAYNFLTSKRPCGPKKDAIRGATYDLAKDGNWKAPFEHLPEYAFTDVASWERQLIQQRVRSMY